MSGGGAKFAIDWSFVVRFELVGCFGKIIVILFVIQSRTLRYISHHVWKRTTGIFNHTHKTPTVAFDISFLRTNCILICDVRRVSLSVLVIRFCLAGLSRKI